MRSWPWTCSVLQVTCGCINQTSSMISLDSRVFRGKTNTLFSSSIVSQAFVLCTCFYPGHFCPACCDLSSFCSWCVFRLDGDQLASSLCRLIPWRLEYCCSFPYLYWEIFFAGHFGRPNRMKLLIKYLSAGVKPSDRRWPLLQGKAFSGP